eukprot:SAG22_NODE_1095_length_5580_cov_3.745302_3_plen_183_part_00
MYTFSIKDPLQLCTPSRSRTLYSRSHTPMPVAPVGPLHPWMAPSGIRASRLPGSRSDLAGGLDSIDSTAPSLQPAKLAKGWRTSAGRCWRLETSARWIPMKRRRSRGNSPSRRAMTTYGLSFSPIHGRSPHSPAYMVLLPGMRVPSRAVQQKLPWTVWLKTVRHATAFSFRDRAHRPSPHVL